MAALDLVALGALWEQAQRQSSRLAGAELLSELVGVAPDGDRNAALQVLAADERACVAIGCFAGELAGFGIARQLPGAIAPAAHPGGEPSGAPGAGEGPRAAVHVGVVGLYVEEGFRGVGVGESIIEALETWAVEVGAVELDVVALPGSRETKALLEARGYKARAILMHRRLG